MIKLEEKKEKFDLKVKENKRIIEKNWEKSLEKSIKIMKSGIESIDNEVEVNLRNMRKEEKKEKE